MDATESNPSWTKTLAYNFDSAAVGSANTSERSQVAIVSTRGSVVASVLPTTGRTVALSMDATFVLLLLLLLLLSF